MLVRDGRDVALSIMGVPFGPNNAWAAARSWAAAVRQGRAAAARYPGRVLEIRYEDLVSKPEETVGAVCGFLDLEYSPDMLAIEQTDRSKVVEDQAGWFTNVWSGITTAAVGKWQTELLARDRWTCSRAWPATSSHLLGYETTGGSPRRLSFPRTPHTTRPCAA